MPITINNDFENFIKTYWSNLNSLSRDYLDIYYSDKDFSMSGYEIKSYFEELDVPENVLPCLIIWEKEIKDAGYINLKELTNIEIFNLMQEIVEKIKNKVPLKYIIEEVNTLANEKREENKPITNYNIDNKNGIFYNGNITQSTVTNSVTVENCGIEVEKEVECVKKKIDELEELNIDQKEYLKSIIEESKSIKDDKSKENCINKFKGFIAGLGNTADSVLKILSVGTSIANFFNIH